MLTTHYDHIGDVKDSIRELVLDYLAVGIDPQKSTIYLQSLVPEVCELTLLFSMLVTVPRLQRVPTLKDKVREMHADAASLGLALLPRPAGRRHPDGARAASCRSARIRHRTSR